MIGQTKKFVYMNTVSLLLFLFLSSLVISCEPSSTSAKINEKKNIADTVAKSIKVDTVAKPLKYIYLTFDDGPLMGSEYIDSVVLAEKLKINVFVVGRNVSLSPLLSNYLSMYEHNPYIETYNHSYTHASNKYKKFYSNPQGVLNDINKNEDLLHLNYKIVRLPGRNIWRVDSRSKNFYDSSGSASANLIAKNGYKIYGWDIEWQHAKNGKPIQSVSTMVHAIETRLQNGTTFTPNNIVVLLHDEMFQKKWEEDELKQLLDSLRRNQDYVFEHIRFYPEK
jgi:peptidoglycan/xylan/chitin deacetylase (PgdA/CDA1 family)